MQTPWPTVVGKNRVWLATPAGASVGIIVIDTLGNQVSGFPLFNTPSHSEASVRCVLPLPGGRLVFSVGWQETHQGTTTNPAGSGIVMADSAHEVIWRTAPASVGSYAITYGANDDGSFCLTRTTGVFSGEKWIERRAADSSLIYSYHVPYATPGSRLSLINAVVYLGGERAYLVGMGRRSDLNNSGYWVGLMEGFGDPYIPTTLKATAGPRAQEAALRLPTPTQQKQVLPSKAKASPAG